MVNHIRVTVILAAIVLAAVLVGFVAAEGVTPDRTWRVGNNFVFSGSIALAATNLSTVPPGHQFVVQDVVFSNPTVSGEFVSLMRGAAGNEQFINVYVPSGGTFDHSFKVTLRQNEILAVSGGPGIAYFVSGTLK